jgi:hypothetical protein
MKRGSAKPQLEIDILIRHFKPVNMMIKIYLGKTKKKKKRSSLIHSSQTE